MDLQKSQITIRRGAYAGFIVAGVTTVVDGEEIGPRDRRMLRSEGVLEPGEDIVFFYSAGIFSIREDGNNDV